MFTTCDTAPLGQDRVTFFLSHILCQLSNSSSDSSIFWSRCNATSLQKVFFMDHGEQHFSMHFSMQPLVTAETWWPDIRWWRSDDIWCWSYAENWAIPKGRDTFSSNRIHSLSSWQEILFKLCPTGDRWGCPEDDRGRVRLLLGREHSMEDCGRQNGTIVKSWESRQHQDWASETARSNILYPDSITTTSHCQNETMKCWHQQSFIIATNSLSWISQLKWKNCYNEDKKDMVGVTGTLPMTTMAVLASRANRVNSIMW